MVIELILSAATRAIGEIESLHTVGTVAVSVPVGTNLGLGPSGEGIFSNAFTFEIPNRILQVTIAGRARVVGKTSGARQEALSELRVKKSSGIGNAVVVRGSLAAHAAVNGTIIQNVVVAVAAARIEDFVMLDAEREEAVGTDLGGTAVVGIADRAVDDLCDKRTADADRIIRCVLKELERISSHVREQAREDRNKREGFKG